MSFFGLFKAVEVVTKDVAKGVAEGTAEKFKEIPRGVTEGTEKSKGEVLRELPEGMKDCKDHIQKLPDDLAGVKERITSLIGGDASKGIGESAGELEKKEPEPLTDDQKEKVKKETGWSDEIVDAVSSWEEYEIYREAGLVEAEINGRPCLVRPDLDLDHIDPKTGKTNKELMEKGRSPIDPETGEKIELHHIGQNKDGPLAELTESEHMKGGNDSILHDKGKESWRNDPEANNKYNNHDRPDHWKGRVNVEENK